MFDKLKGIIKKKENGLPMISIEGTEDEKTELDILAEECNLSYFKDVKMFESEWKKRYMKPNEGTMVR